MRKLIPLLTLLFGVSLACPAAAAPKSTPKNKTTCKTFVKINVSPTTFAAILVCKTGNKTDVIFGVATKRTFPKKTIVAELKKAIRVGIPHLEKYFNVKKDRLLVYPLKESVRGKLLMMMWLVRVAPANKTKTSNIAIPY